MPAAASVLLRMLWLQHGTRPHTIRPKAGEAVNLNAGCVTVIAARFEHAGSESHHVFALAPPRQR